MARLALVPTTAVMIFALLVSGGCARSPEAKKARHLQRGDTYAQKEKYREAIFEYRSALRYEQTNVRAIRQLGLIHYQLGELAQAYGFLLKAQEMEPDNLDVRLKLGTMYLAGRQREQAREEAAFILQRQPNNLDALILSAGTATTPEETGAAIRRLEDARAAFGDRAKLHVALGSLYLGQKDLTAAERAFTEGVTREPKSIEAHRALGGFYLAKRDAVRAEAEYKAAAAIAPPGSPEGLGLADFYLLVRQPEEAKQVLRTITEKAPEYLPAWRRLAEIAFVEQKYDETVQALRVILKKNASDVEAHLLMGRVHLARQQATEAIQEFQQMLKLAPRLAPFRRSFGSHGALSAT